jgi:DNA-binding transcriptional MerR regulator
MSTHTQTSRTYTIMEAAKLSGLPESTLRYYETIGIIDPIRRDSSSKQRVYDENDINLVVAVSCLSATGMSIKDMRQYLQNRSRGADAADDQISLLADQQRRLTDEARFLKLRQQYVDTKIEYWRAVGAGDETGIEAAKHAAESIAAVLKLKREK